MKEQCLGTSYMVRFTNHFMFLEAVLNPRGLIPVIFYFNQSYVVDGLISVRGKYLYTFVWLNGQWHLSKIRGFYKNLGFPKRVLWGNGGLVVELYFNLNCSKGARLFLSKVLVYQLDILDRRGHLKFTNQQLSYKINFRFGIIFATFPLE